MTETKKETKSKGGRPSDYTQEIATELCSRIARGKSLRTVCKADDMPSVQTVYTWMNRHEEFLEQYARAKDDSADADADKLDEIAEKVLIGGYDPQAARVAADIIKWSASKKKPKRYGNNIGLDVKGDAFGIEKLAALEEFLKENGINARDIK